MLKFFGVIFLACTVSAGALRGGLQVSTCPGVDAPIPVNIIVSSCEAPPCNLLQGESYGVEVDFELLGRNSTSLRVQVFGILGGVELPFGIDGNGCAALTNGGCPMHDGDYFTYSGTLKVEEIYPVTPLVIKWQIRDDDEKPIWCFLLPAEIKPANK